MKLWQGQNVRDYLTAESIPKLNTRIAALLHGDSTTRGVELDHIDGTQWKFPIRYTLHQIALDRTLLLLGRLDVPETTTVATDKLSENLACLYNFGADAIIFTDEHGNIQAANESFLNLVDVAQASNVKLRKYDLLARN